MPNKELSVRIRADDQASAVFDKVGNSAKTMGQMLEEAGKSGAGLQTLSQQIAALDQELTQVGQGLTAAGAVGTGLFGLATRESMQFTSAMANVNSIARLTKGELDDVSASVLDMATSFGAAPETLAAGLYEIQSSGFQTADAMEILEASVVAAGAGMTTTDVSARAITATLNAYRMEADEAGNVSDVLFKIVDSGVITFEALANNLGNTLPLAASLGVAIEELGAAYAQLTLSGVGASQAETQIAALMRSTLNQTEALTAALEEYGYASAEALIASEGLAGYLQFLADASGGTSAGLLELVGTAEAVNAALILGANGGADFAATIEEMGGAAQDGAYTLEVFGIQMGNAAGAVRLAQAELSAAAINLGAGLEPLVGFGAEAVAGVVGAFNDLPPAIQGTVAMLGALGSAATLATGGFMLLLPKVLEFRTAMTTLGGARGIAAILGSGLGNLAMRINPVVAGLGVLAAGGVAVYRAFQDQKEAAEDYIGSLESLDDVLEQIRLRGDEGLANIGDNIRTEIDRLTALLYDAEQGPLTFFEDLDLAAQGVDPTWFSNVLEQDFNRAYDLADQLNLRIAEALQNPDVDQEGYVRWVQDMLKTVEITAEGSNIDEVFAEILNRPLSDFSEAAADATISASEFGAEMARLRTILDGGAPVTVDELATAVTTLDEAIAAGEVNRRAVSEWIEDLDRQMATGAISYAQYQEEVARGVENLDQFQNSAKGTTTELHNLDGVIAGTTERWTEKGQAVDDVTARLGEYGAAVRDAIASTLELTDNADFLSQWNVTAFGGQASNLAEHIREVGAALDDTFRVIVGNTDAIGSQMQGLKDWSDTLIGDPGTWAEVDALLNEGRISLEQYTAAQEAQVAITEANATVQRDLLAIQAMQAPVLAESAENMADYVFRLREMNDGTEEGAQRQLAALGMLDDAMLGQVQQFSELSSLYLNMGPQGAAALEEMVDAIAATNPVLTAMLEEMGLIVEVAEGEYDFNLDASGAISDIDQLNSTIGDLIDLLDDGKLNDTYTPNVEIEVSGQDDLERVKQDIYDLTTGDAQARTVAIALELGGGDPLAPLIRDLEQNPPSVPVTIDLPDNLPELLAPAEDVEIPVTFYVAGATGEKGLGNLPDYSSLLPQDLEAEIQITARNDQAVAMMDAMRAFDGMVLAEPLVSIAGENDAAVGVIQATAGYNGVVIAEPIVSIQGDNAPAVGVINATSGYDGVTIATPLVVVAGDNSPAVATINATAGYDGLVIATAYVNIVARDLTGGLSRASGGMIPGYAAGGVLFEAAEVGPEIAHFASGGSAVLSHHGLYMAPPGTYIAPNSTVDPGGGGGLTVYAPITVEGSVFGIDDLIEASTRAIAPAMGEVAKRAMREQGVTL